MSDTVPLRPTRRRSIAFSTVVVLLVAVVLGLCEIGPAGGRGTVVDVRIPVAT